MLRLIRFRQLSERPLPIISPDNRQYSVHSFCPK